MNKYYAGIGSRKTPTSVSFDIEFIVKKLNNLNYILRSGGALGADEYFETYANKKQIFLPWKGFRKKYGEDYIVPELTNELLTIAEKYHPNWKACSFDVRYMHARNVCQILGEDLKSPVDFVICWTKDGKASGGTGQALRIAQEFGIPIYNLKNEEAFHDLMEMLDNTD